MRNQKQPSGGAMESLEREDFAACFATLEKSADRTRSTIYVFLIVYAAVAVYTLNAFIYPARQFRFETVKAQLADIAHCRMDPQDLVPSTRNSSKPPTCDALLRGNAFSREVTAQYGSIEQDYLGHVVQRTQDDSARIADFTVPVVGVVTDRDWFWLINALAGVLVYYMIIACFETYIRMLDYLLTQSTGNAARLRMILTTIVLTAPHHLKSKRRVLSSAAIWRVFLPLLMGLPIVVSALLVRDHYLILHRAMRLWSGSNFLSPDGIKTFLWVAMQRDNYFFGAALLISTACLIWQALLLMRIVRGMMYIHQCFAGAMGEVARMEQS